MVRRQSLFHFICSCDCVLIGCADDVNEQDERGQTPLHCAVENEREAIVELMCESSKSGRLTVDTSISDNHKRTALHLAVTTGKVKLVQVCGGSRERNAMQQKRFMKSCFECQMVLSVSREVDHLGPNNRTPLHMAAMDKLPEIAQLLVSDLQ